ncbi:MAG: UPF0175 family protein [Phascolarctobacterium sp.]|nr:UPF0175 family protein [Phascolarctobacterium sp.]
MVQKDEVITINPKYVGPSFESFLAENLTEEEITLIKAKAKFLNEESSICHLSEIAGMSKEEFIKYLGANKISICDYADENEFLDELKNA